MNNESSSSESEDDYQAPVETIDHVTRTMSDRIQLIINKGNNITDQDKLFIFEYCKSSPEDVHKGETLDKFAKNLIILINSFFEFGFSGKGPTGDAEVSHYWELITYYFSTYSSVSYINDQLGRSHKYPERALSWLILVLNEENLLSICFSDIFANPDFLTHYSEQTSYFFNYQKDLLEIGHSVYRHKLFINSKINQ